MSTREHIVSPRRTAWFALLAALSVATFAVSFVVTSRNTRSGYVPVMEPTSEKIAWQPSYEAAQKAARAGGKPLMMVFHADWCGVCKEMEGQTFPDARVVRASRSFVPVRIDTDKRTDVALQFRATSLPTIIWLNERGELLGRISGFYAPDELAELMQKVRSQPAPTS